MIVYTKENGKAHSLTRKKDDYVLQANEFQVQGDVFPDIDTLHSEPYVSAKALTDTMNNRKRAYLSEADPLFLEWKYLEAIGDAGALIKKQEWLDKQLEIKVLYPK